MESGKHGLTRGTCAFVRRLEVVAVAGLLMISGVFWVGRIISCFSGHHIFKFVDAEQSASTR